MNGRVGDLDDAIGLPLALVLADTLCSMLFGLRPFSESDSFPRTVTI